MVHVLQWHFWMSAQSPMAAKRTTQAQATALYPACASHLPLHCLSGTSPSCCTAPLPATCTPTCAATAYTLEEAQRKTAEDQVKAAAAAKQQGVKAYLEQLRQ